MPTKQKRRKNRADSKEPYIPSKKAQETLTHIGGKMTDMVEVRDQKYRQFNDRTLIAFLDDSQKRVLGYVPSRESQGKSEDQANVFSQDTRTKLKAIVAAVANKPPQQKFRAVSKYDKASMDPARADVMKNLVQHSRQRPGHNAQLDIFWEAWNTIVSGTCVKYDAYLKSKVKRKFIKSFNKTTGEIEFDEKEVTINDEMADINIPLREIFIGNIRVKNIQDQPRLAWITYKDYKDAEFELGNYKDWDYVKGKNSAKYESDVKTFFHEWQSRVDDDEVEIVRYYSIVEDKYVIVANGVLLLDSPMLWGDAEKRYPFSKTIFEPFIDDEFFYGNSIANVNMDVQDVINALWNMMLDKFAYSIDKPIVSGVTNKDLLEQEQENMGLEHTMYVEDVSQIKELDVRGLTNAEFGLLSVAQKKMDSQTVSKQQQGFAGEGVTAREIIIANEHAKQLKGMFFDFLSDLWLQKTQIRIINIMQHYTIPQVREVTGKDGSTVYQEMFRPILVEEAELPGGEKGTLQIDIKPSREELPTQDEIDIEEEKMRVQGENFQKMAITPSFLDNYDYDVIIVTESLYNQSKVERRAHLEEKASKMASLFPYEFLFNKDILFREFAEAYDDDPTRYRIIPPQMMMQMQQGKEEKKE